MKTAMLTTTAATLGLLTTASAAVAQQDFETLDADGDSHLDADELAEWVDDEGMFTRWDIDRDSEVDADEVNEAIYTIWDVDDDGAADPVLGYDEFIDRFYTLWDLDDDGLLDTLEYHGGAAYWVF